MQIGGALVNAVSRTFDSVTGGQVGATATGVVVVVVDGAIVVVVVLPVATFFGVLFENKAMRPTTRPATTIAPTMARRRRFRLARTCSAATLTCRRSRWRWRFSLGTARQVSPGRPGTVCDRDTGRTEIRRDFGRRRGADPRGRRLRRAHPPRRRRRRRGRLGDGQVDRRSHPT